MVLGALLFLWVLGLSALVFYTFFWIEMLVHAIKYPFATPNKKYIWIATIFTGVGALLYYFNVKKQATA